jgi:hypothetical protein
MPVSLYEISIPVFIRSLTNLSAILKKGEAYADEKGIPHSKLLDARLVEDMAALPFQIQRCSDIVKGAAARVTGVQNVVMADNETTFEELQARIHKTIEFLKSVEPTSMDGKEESPVFLKIGGGEIKFTSKSYLLDYALPNIFFHVSMAYGILVSSPCSSVMLCCIFSHTFLFMFVWEGFRCSRVHPPTKVELTPLTMRLTANRGIWVCRSGREIT